MTNSDVIPDLKHMAKEYEPAMLRLLQDLVRLPSVNGRDSEAAVAQRLQTEARQLGFPAQLVAADLERPNALISWGSGQHGFLFVGHMDTVAAGDEAAWTSPPFAAEVRDGRVFGRGTADNKAGLVCALYTLALIRDQQLLDPTDVKLIVAGVVDEESGASSPLGVRHLLDEGYLQLAQGAIYTYASDIVCVGHRGLLRLRLTARGRSVHTGSEGWSRGEGGVNAVTGLAAVLLALEQLELPAPAHPAFNQMHCTVTPGTLFNGGEFESIVPAQAEALVDVRLLPGQDVAEVLTAVQACIDGVLHDRPGLALALAIKNQLPAAVIPVEHPLVRVAQRHTERWTGQAWPIAGAGPANEGYMLIEAGIPTLCGFGPTGDQAHAPDEWVDINSLSTTVAMFSGILLDYLTDAGASLTEQSAAQS